jgi:hypothetical protein
MNQNGGGYAYPASAMMIPSFSSSSGHLPSPAIYSLPIAPAGASNGSRKQQQNKEDRRRKSKVKATVPSVKTPRDSLENRALKEAANFEEDDNEDIAYLNFRLIWSVTMNSL